jgi:hypothetical protein
VNDATDSIGEHPAETTGGHGCERAGRSAPLGRRDSGGTLSIAGGPRAEQIALRLSALDPNQLQVDLGDDGSAESTFDLGTFRVIEVAAGNGDDTVRIDPVNGAFTTTLATRIDGGNGDDTLIGGSGAQVFFGGNGRWGSFGRYSATCNSTLKRSDTDASPSHGCQYFNERRPTPDDEVTRKRNSRVPPLPNCGSESSVNASAVPAISGSAWSISHRYPVVGFSGSRTTISSFSRTEIDWP